MNRRLIALGLSTLLALVMSAGVSSADHHEKEKGKPPAMEHEDHGKHKGHEKAPAKGKGHDMSGDKGHGNDHKEHGKKPKADRNKK